MSRWLTSPLSGTAAVIAALAWISMPLRRLTSAPPVAQVSASAVEVVGREIPAVLRVRLLTSAQRVRLETRDGSTLLEQQQVAAGISEHDVRVALEQDELAVVLHADFGTGQADTAVFLTVMPDGREEQTRYSIGQGKWRETLRYNWRHTH